MESMPPFRNLMSAYIHAFLEQVLVSVACNGAHSLKERLARIPPGNSSHISPAEIVAFDWDQYDRRR
jgi:hypothetical protein